jgi:hypothetical protein
MDMHSGELHKKFHETLDQKIAELQRKALEQMEEAFANGGGGPPSIDMDGSKSGEAKPPAAVPKLDTTPVPSIFKELKPSDKRYSLLQKTEL